jgi:hypothetical protein
MLYKIIKMASLSMKKRSVDLCIAQEPAERAALGSWKKHENLSTANGCGPFGLAKLDNRVTRFCKKSHILKIAK